MFASLFKAELEVIEKHLRSVLSERPHPGLEKFWECMNYSLLSEGKRFRPLLSLLTAKALDKSLESALPLATAVELIHTYSLIHDDLPVMDNDDFRRGRPTNHKVYGEAQALLAGDGLLTMAFGALAESKSPHLREALQLLSEAAGPVGMVGGQVLDVAMKNPGEAALADIHKRKTGALIRVSVEGTAVLLGATADHITKLKSYGEHLGMAFQLADDIQDHDPKNPEKISYVTLLGPQETQKRLQQVSEQATEALRSFGRTADGPSPHDSPQYRAPMKRLDAALVEWGLAPSRTKAQAMIAAGEIEWNAGGEWKIAGDNSFNVSHLTPEDVRVKADSQTLKYVSRGGLKLESAFAHLKLQARGWRCLDLGLSTGGFSDFLLQSQASSILGIDVGHGQLHPNLHHEPKLISLERLHVKDLPSDARVKEWLEQGVDLCVADLSFISLTQVLPTLAGILPQNTPVLALVKPQYESGRQTVTPELFDDVQSRILHAADKCGFSSIDYFSSAVKGQDGNQEFFLWARRR